MKKKQSEYEWVRARVTCDEELRITYKLRDCLVSGRHDYDDSVIGWTDTQIRELVADLIKCKPEEVEVRWE
jgi:hypothetical protein